jgi:hypothetical protein
LLLLLLRVLLCRFVQDAAEGSYDMIIVDSSDPVGPAEVLYQQVSLGLACRVQHRQHIQSTGRALHPNLVPSAVFL